MSWEEIADRCFRRRYEPFDVTVGVVLGARGAVLVDTRASAGQGHELRTDLRTLGVAEPYAVVNTHGHFDHCFGNRAFDPPYGRWGHVSVPEYLSGRVRATMAEEFPDWARQVGDEPVAAPDRTVTAQADLDLGDRTVALSHLGAGHTAGDLVVWVPDTGCLFAGDLVEESGPPAYGSDSHPLEWPATLDRLIGLYGDRPDIVVVPGHGDPVGPGFVATQRNLIARVAELITIAHAAGADPAEALGAQPGRTAGPAAADAGGPSAPFDWPYDPRLLGHAVRRGYRSLDVSLPGTAGTPH